MIHNHITLNDFLNDRRFSHIHSHNPNPIDFPLFNKARSMVVTIQEGECLIIPSGWLHLVYSEEPGMTGLNIALSLWRFNKSFDELECFEGGKVYSTNLPITDEMSHTSILNAFHTSTPMKGCFPLKSSVTIEDIYEIDKKVMVWINKGHLIPSNITGHHFPYRTYELTMEQFIYKTPLFPCDDKTFYVSKTIYDPFTNPFVKKRIPDVCKSIDFNTYILWMNHGHVHTYLHYDTMDNILYQLQGQKRIFLFPPTERPYLYMLNPYPLKFLFSLNNHSVYNKNETSLTIDKQTSFTEIESQLYPFILKYMTTLYYHKEDSYSFKLDSFEWMDIQPKMRYEFNEFENHTTQFVFYLLTNECACDVIIYLYQDIIPIVKIGTLIIIPINTMYTHCINVSNESVTGTFLKGIIQKD